MSFDLAALRARVASEGRVARVVVAATAGSVPRDVGTAMLVWDGGQSGTIGGGALEFEAARHAEAALSDGDRFDKISLGSDRGQCCGGGVHLVTEVWDAARLQGLTSLVARPLPGQPGQPSLRVARLLRDARSGAEPPRPGIVDGWMIEPVTSTARDIWIWGAGHVGRAIAGVLAPLPGVDLTWADTGQDRFPDDAETLARVLVANNPADLVTLAGGRAEHLVLTYSHSLDLDLCHRILMRPFQRLGLIGSLTKRARFRKRLLALGHAEAQIDRMECPIGQPALGKHPQAIAIGVAADLMRAAATPKLEKRA